MEFGEDRFLFGDFVADDFQPHERQAARSADEQAVLSLPIDVRQRRPHIPSSSSCTASRTISSPAARADADGRSRCAA